MHNSYFVIFVLPVHFQLNCIQFLQRNGFIKKQETRWQYQLTLPGVTIQFNSIMKVNIESNIICPSNSIHLIQFLVLAALLALVAADGHLDAYPKAYYPSEHRNVYVS